MIKEYRKRVGLTQKQLADKLNVSQSVISRHERDEKIYCKMCQKLRLGIYNLMEAERVANTYQKNSVLFRYETKKPFWWRVLNGIKRFLFR